MKTTITVRGKDGAVRKIEAQCGSLLSDILRQNRYDMDMPCAGKGICKKCSVFVDNEYCLACRTEIFGGMHVELCANTSIDNIATGNYSRAQPRYPMYTRYGLSADIGSTTVCASLLDRSGAVRTTTRKNPQTSFGADVISRIERALAGDLSSLTNCIRVALGEMITDLCGEEGINPADIDAAVITGNTSMLYLLTGQNPETLSRAPFQADRLFGEYVSAQVLGLPMLSAARVYLPKGASAFVGGDVATAIIASGMCDQIETSMLVDIGTNGEIALWRQGRLICCSTAAGPTFEGAGITCGTYGVNGAIDHVWHENRQIRYSTIGGASATGICGSGIVDALAVMLELGIVDETGAFADGRSVFTLLEGINMTVQDVRKLQLAKGSVRAGMESLMQISGVARQEIKRLYISGGFGSHIDLKNAAAVGLIPKELLSRAKVIGNGAHTGASMLLCDKTFADVSESLMALSHTVALDANPIFTDNFMTYMMF